MNIGVVIPATAGREDNLMAVLACLEAQTFKPRAVAVVDDGGQLDMPTGLFDLPGLFVVDLPKHEPGMEQPRNIGARWLRGCNWTEITHAWFLDSDVVVEPDCLEQICLAYEELSSSNTIHSDVYEGYYQGGLAAHTVMVCPYDWLQPGLRPEVLGERFIDRARTVRNDPRWASFDQRGAVTGDLSAGLACFSGNLVWPLEQFERVGGFWSELHHGRCEDGELGLRAVSMGVPIAFAREARGYHLAHPVNHALALERNARDVPMLNDRHPWVQGADVFMVDRDGKAFDVRCSKCTEQIPTIGWWAHAAECLGTTALPVR